MYNETETYKTSQKDGRLKDYIGTILKEKNVEDAAIVGYSDNKSVWASKPGGLLAAVPRKRLSCVGQVEVLVGKDRASFLNTGITTGGKKTSVIRDNLLKDNDAALDARIKGGDGKSLAVGKTEKVLVFLMGKKGVHGRKQEPTKLHKKMGDWKDYIGTILKEKNVEDAAIVGYSDNKSVWASKPGGLLAAVTPQEVEVLVGKDQASFLNTGITIGGKKTSVIRDNLLKDNDAALDARIKGGDGKSLAVGKTEKVLVFLMGKKGVHGRVLNKKVHEMVKYLKSKGS
ncbi:UNVERIFIED_CONTAM: hypothetical protein FKN15_029572 [Acipenser sinensis]